MSYNVDMFELVDFLIGPSRRDTLFLFLIYVIHIYTYSQYTYNVKTYIYIYQSILIPSWENVHELLVWWINCYCSTRSIFWIFIYWSSFPVVSNPCTSSEESAGDVPNSEPGWESGLLSRDAEFSKAGTLLFTDAEEMTALEGLPPFHKKTKF